MNAIKPMLAVSLDGRWEHVRYPALVSPKVDGFRCIIRDGVAYSRSGKPIPSLVFQAAVRSYRSPLNNLDGEIVVGNPTAPDVFNVTSGAMRSVHGNPDFRFLIFDDVTRPNIPYLERLRNISGFGFPSWAEVLRKYECFSQEQVEECYSRFVQEGYEGVIIRDPRALYKFGRSTLNEGSMFKLKGFTDAEAVIIGVDEKMHNANEAFRDELGRTKRSSHQAGQVPAGTLGALHVRLHSNPAIEFRIGTGFDDATRDRLWADRARLPGQIVKFKYMTHGVLESTGVPRHPVFLGFRAAEDL